MQMTNGDSQEASEVEAVSLKGQGCIFHPAIFSPHSKFDGKHSKFDGVVYTHGKMLPPPLGQP